ncbi:MAG: indole-3-glycerol phosphate synthase TrpC [Gemmatimonadales bacterium]
MSPATLDQILDAARQRVEGLYLRRRDLERAAAAAPPRPPFGPAVVGATVGVIAEVKRRSPSAGTIHADLDAAEHASAYAQGGAVAISVLTDEVHFGGSIADLARVAEAVRLPVLRKDFVLDELQLVEARAAGASAVLLIARVVSGGRLAALARAARGLGLATLVEVHSEDELDRALAAGGDVVGVNARDLASYAVDLGVVERLVPRVPPEVPAVAESGVNHRADVERVAAAGADLVLVGSALARRTDPAAAVRELAGVTRRRRPVGGAP